MTTLKAYNSYGEDLERILLLRTSPIAVKMLEKEADIPKEAVRPKRNGFHLAQCQAFAMSRREKATVAMLQEDNWCPTPVMTYGMEERPQDAPPPAGHHIPYECFEHGKYIGILTAPLRTATYEPDVVLIYSNTAQLRNLLLAMKLEERSLMNSHFFPPSCSYAVVYPILTGQYWVVLPDPGEYERALGGEDEMIFAVPKDKIGGLISDLGHYEEQTRGYTHSDMIMRPDFPQPELYKGMFRSWGMDFEE
ncbi:DUF169 domain-containing protein [Chloroflexota bacterium]